MAGTEALVILRLSGRMYVIELRVMRKSTFVAERTIRASECEIFSHSCSGVKS